MKKNNLEKDKMALPPPRQSFKILDSLEPGASLLLPLAAYNSLGAALTFRRRRYGAIFRRALQDNGVRVWRIS